MCKKDIKCISIGFNHNLQIVFVDYANSLCITLENEKKRCQVLKSVDRFLKKNYY